MALTALMAASTAAGVSADIVVTSALPANIGLFTTAGPVPEYAVVTIQRKDPNGNYRDTGIALSRFVPDVFLNAIGTYRASRLDLTQISINLAQVAVGVVMDQ
jgi:hypothetical protein